MRPVVAIAYAAPLLAYSALVYAVSALTAPPAPEYPFEWGDKISHAGAYAVMYVLAVRASRVLGEDRSIGFRYVSAFLFCVIYGASDELHQYFVPGRSCDIFDWLADAVGAGAAALALPLAARWKPISALVGGTR